MSIAGGLHRAVQRAHDAGCQCVQFFSKNNNQWKAKPITDEAAERFRQALTEFGLVHPLIHDSYLINLASPERKLWKRSVDAMVEELRRAELLGVPYVVTHPGAYTTSSEEKGLRQVIQAVDEVDAQTADWNVQLLLETTAGQGTSLGWRFEHLATILDEARSPDRLGVCFDTCHVFAAGYPLGTAKEYRTTMRQFDETVGIGRIKAFHFNDSRRELGSRVDRHHHIGEGEMGTEPFRRLLTDRRLAKIPVYLETPKEERDGVPMDKVNLGLLRELARKRRK
jgi:deoxyribonuclease-4